MNNKQRFFVSFAILIVVMFGLYFFTDWFSRVTGYFTGEEEKVKLGQCLEGKGVEFYTSANYCEDCFKQEEELGKGLNYLSKIECQINSNNQILNEDCSNLRQIPAFYINRSFVYGYKSLAELKILSGCID
jgi:hypothetical protein